MNRANAAVLLLLMLPAAVAAQTDERPVLLPGVRFFDSPIADPLEPRFSIGLARTDLFTRQGPERPRYFRPPAATTEIQAVASIGTTIPLLLLSRRADGGTVLGVTAGVSARFRVERPSRDDLGQDWTVGVPLEMKWGTSAARVRIVHRSSHLGDEFAVVTGASRIEMGGEALDAMYAQGFGSVRAYGGAGWIFHSNTDNTAILQSAGRGDRYTVQAGMDGRFHPFGSERLSVAAGADWQTAQRTAWRSTWGAIGGVFYDSGRGAGGLVVRYIGGRSTVGQFFLTPENVWSLELHLSANRLP